MSQSAWRKMIFQNCWGTGYFVAMKRGKNVVFLINFCCTANTNCDFVDKSEPEREQWTCSLSLMNFYRFGCMYGIPWGLEGESERFLRQHKQQQPHITKSVLTHANKMTTLGNFNIKCIICKLWRDTIFSLKDTIFLSKLWSVFNFPGLLMPSLMYVPFSFKSI